MDKNEKLISWKKGQQNHFPVLLASTLVLASTRVWILIEVMPKPKPNKMSGKNESTEKATFKSVLAFLPDRIVRIFRKSQVAAPRCGRVRR